VLRSLRNTVSDDDTATCLHYTVTDNDSVTDNRAYNRSRLAYTVKTVKIK